MSVLLWMKRQQVARQLQESELRAFRESGATGPDPALDARSSEDDASRLRAIPVVVRGGLPCAVPDTAPGAGASLRRLERWHDARRNGSSGQSPKP